MTDKGNTKCMINHTYKDNFFFLKNKGKYCILVLHFTCFHLTAESPLLFLLNH